jgi:hypothetical protein
VILTADNDVRTLPCLELILLDEELRQSHFKEASEAMVAVIIKELEDVFIELYHFEDAIQLGC